MLLIVYLMESFVLEGELPFKTEVLSLGTVLGASAIVIGESIRSISRATDRVSRALRDLPAKQVEAEEEKYEVPSSKNTCNKKEFGSGEDKDEEPICYDFMYS